MRRVLRLGLFTQWMCMIKKVYILLLLFSEKSKIFHKRKKIPVWHWMRLSGF
ncbi:hypothetical protein THIOM_000227 [Candidatus Thiomargarita nelsonii]|uniref:Uncharacterized protein n=1 Tax=Candidatus Thiomargarita nelsonii TaxID=1003181 RepID=A0A176S7B4_9GAMM|nr:hypothetical protein THIOM_000227 [Candidatus Thiomargarita nelsonii]